MLRPSIDIAFDFGMLRMLAHARYGGSDVAELVQVASKITPGDFEIWHSAWLELAQLGRLASQK